MSGLNNGEDSNDENRLPNPFDSYFRASFAHHAVQVEFCNVYLPSQLSDNFDYKTLRLVETSFIDDDLRHYASDLVFECELKPSTVKSAHNDTVSTKYRVALLIEHQSSPDKSMALRVHQYMMNIFTNQLKQNKSKHKKLTPVYPVIFYNGRQTPYPYSLDLFDSFADPLNIMPEVFGQSIPLIDLNLLDDNDLKKQQLLGIVTRALKYRNEAQDVKSYLTELLSDLHLMLNDVEQGEFKSYFKPLVIYLSHLFGEKQLAMAVVENATLPKAIKGEFMTAYEFYLNKGKVLGLEEGKVLGLEEGKVIGLEKGEYQKSVRIAKIALLKGMEASLIADLTELDIKTIEMLAEQV